MRILLWLQAAVVLHAWRIVGNWRSCESGISHGAAGSFWRTTSLMFVTMWSSLLQAVGLDRLLLAAYPHCPVKYQSSYCKQPSMIDWRFSGMSKKPAWYSCRIYGRDMRTERENGEQSFLQGDTQRCKFPEKNFTQRLCHFILFPTIKLRKMTCLCQEFGDIN